MEEMEKWKVGVASVLFASGLACGCVSGRAWIETPEGRRRLEEIDVGDEVLCVDPETGEREVGRVTDVKRTERECVALDVGAEASLVCTSDHPVYDPAAGEYADAGDWAVEERAALFVDRGAGFAAAEVAGVETYAGIHEVYDITVDNDLHNFVANGFLVHNKSPPRTDFPTRDVDASDAADTQQEDTALEDTGGEEIDASDTDLTDADGEDTGPTDSGPGDTGGDTGADDTSAGDTTSSDTTAGDTAAAPDRADTATADGTVGDTSGGG